MKHPALRYILISLMTGTLAIVAFPALSQGPGGPGGHGPGHGAGYGASNRLMDDDDDGPSRWERMRERWEERHAERMELLEFRLKLTDAQQPAWKALQAAQAAHHDGRFAKRQALQDAKNLQDYFTQKIAMAEAQLASLKKVAEAAQTLYGLLTPEQQKVLDDFMAERPYRAGRGRN